MTDETSEDQRMRARWALERAVNELVRDMCGDDGFQRRPAYPGATSTFLRPRPIPALRAVEMLRKLCQREQREHVRAAREQGSSWEEVAEALGITGDADYSAGQHAYEQTRGPVPRGYSDWTYSFRCGTCGQLIADRGPYGSPGNNEQGHGQGCARFAAEVAADAERWGDQL